MNEILKHVRVLRTSIKNYRDRNKRIVFNIPVCIFFIQIKFDYYHSQIKMTQCSCMYTYRNLMFTCSVHISYMKQKREFLVSSLYRRSIISIFTKEYYNSRIILIGQQRFILINSRLVFISVSKSCDAFSPKRNQTLQTTLQALTAHFQSYIIIVILTSLTVI